VPGAARAPSPEGVLLEDLTWQEAERVLTPDAVVVIPIGAQAKEHGPHLKLRNDWTIAEYLKGRIVERSKVVVAPTVNYHFYPAFVEYPGSTSLRLAKPSRFNLNFWAPAHSSPPSISTSRSSTRI
jgi:creatinine amidohydrolase